MNRLTGKVGLVTGGTRGIGRAIVQAFLEEGARVAFCGSTATSLENARASIGHSDHVYEIAADLADIASSQRIVKETVKAFGKIDIVVTSAGVVSRSNIWELTPEEWDRIHAINLRATFFVARDAALAMRDRRSGSIITISSIAGQNGGLAGSPAYASSKAAVIGLTRALARRMAPDGVRVNCIAPADIETEMTANWPDSLRDQLNAITPLGRFGQVEEVAGAAIYLASEESSFVTGQTFSINGGAYLG